MKNLLFISLSVELHTREEPKFDGIYSYIDLSQVSEYKVAVIDKQIIFEGDQIPYPLDSFPGYWREIQRKQA